MNGFSAIIPFLIPILMGAVLIVLGCQALWLVVPLGTLWLLSRFLGTAAECLIAGLIAMPLRTFQAKAKLYGLSLDARKRR